MIDPRKGCPSHLSHQITPRVTATLTKGQKVTIRLSPLPNTPQLRQPRFKCSSNQRFEYIVRFLRKKLNLKDHESVFCYVNSVFSPSLDEGVGNLWRVSFSCCLLCLTDYYAVN